MDTNTTALAADMSSNIVTADGDLSVFVDHDVIAKWQKHHERCSLRHSVAINALKEAKVAHNRATEVAYRELQRGPVEGDPRATEAALEAAGKELAVCQKMFDASSRGLAESNEQRTMASGLAHKPLYLHGVEMRIAAAERGDAARRELAEAERDYRHGTDVMLRAVQAGCSDVHQGLSHQVLQSAAAERAHWASRNVDVERGVHPWDPGLLAGAED